MWKKLWIMCKTQWRQAFGGVTTPLWEKLRNNIFTKKENLSRERAGKAGGIPGHLNLWEICVILQYIGTFRADFALFWRIYGIEETGLRQ